MTSIAGAAPAPAPMKSGLDPANMDRTVRPGDDFYQYINGHWLATTEIPADKASYGAGNILDDKTLLDLRGIVEAVGKAPRNDGERKIGDLYASYMDEAKLETFGLKPLQPELDRIDAIKSASDLPALIAQFAMVGIDTPFGGSVHQDNKDSTKYVVDFSQGGLGLPDRDYYLKDDDAKLKQIRDAYLAHIERMLTLSGDANGKDDAASVLALETSIAKVQWTKVENRDPNKVYNKYLIKDLDGMMPGFNWNTFLTEAQVAGKVDYVIVSQPSYFTAMAGILKNTPIPVWKAYFRWQALHAAAPYLSKAFVDENFAFVGTALYGIPQNRVRWQRGIRLVNSKIGEQLGQAYVARFFPPESKARVTELVHNLLAAYKQSIDKLDWMSPATKVQAQAKLATYMLKLGYPDQWRDYSSLRIDRGDLLGNVWRANEFEYMRNVNKLGKPIDRTEWDMSPQTINAYYNPEMNEIVFPAAILQAPFFNAKADDAVNYGAIGAVIGHEISHGFDDQGSQYDGTGNLHDWWTKGDHDAFKKKTSALVSEYNAFEPVKGYHINGELTLGENIADNSGLAIAYKAYKISLHGKKSPVIDGMTGEQRFYAGYAQVWEAKIRENAMIAQIKSDPHSIAVDRVMGAVVNQPGFYDAFNVKPGDKMYVAPAQRVIIW
jgi:predicted metalloendopeptidase